MKKCSSLPKFYQQIEEFGEHFLDKTDNEIKTYISNLTICKAQIITGYTESLYPIYTTVNCFGSMQALFRSGQK